MLPPGPLPPAVGPYTLLPQWVAAAPGRVPGGAEGGRDRAGRGGADLTDPPAPDSRLPPLACWAA